MPFTQSTFAPVGPQSTDAPSVYTYSTTDTLATVKGAGYFVDKENQLESGDVLFTQTGDGFAIVEVSATTSTVTEPSFGGGSAKEIIINSEAEFPTQDATTITLETGFAYRLGDVVTTGKRFICEPNSAITGPSLNIPVLVYTGTGSMFTTTSQFYMFQLNFSCANGSIFDHNGPGFVVLNSCVCPAVKNVGVVSSGLITFIHTAFFNIATAGLSFTGTGNQLVMIDTLFATTNAMKVVDLGTATFSNIDIAETAITTQVGGFGLSGTTASGNMEGDHIGAVFDSDIGGDGTPLENITADDAQWTFVLNESIRDTWRDALVSVQGNTTETVIALEATPVKAAATFVVGPQSGFTGDTTGRITYDLLKDTRVPITASLTLKKASGGTARVLAGIAENGSIVSQSRIGVDCSGSVSGNVTLVWQSDLSQTNYIEIFLENPTGAGTVNNVLVDAVFRAN